MRNTLSTESGTARRRSMFALFGGVVLMTTATVAVSTMGTLVADRVAGPAWSGVPNAAAVLGTAIGTTALSTVVARRGRRTGLLLGYVAAAAGGLLAAFGAGVGSLLLLLPGMVLLGIGNGGAQLGRYLAGDLYPPERRGFAIGIVVWGGTAGALIGPGLFTLSDSAAGRSGLPAATGPYLLALLVALLGVAVTAALLGRHRPGNRPRPQPDERLSALLRLPLVKIALAAMISAQIAMVSVMTMTPLQMQMSGHGLGTISAILTVHMVGMFGLAPLSGRIAGRFGGLRTVGAGLAVLVIAAVCASLAPGVDSPIGFGALFLLGYGWNLSFVGGSTLLSSGLPAASRTRLQGAVDGLAWTASALASIGSGVLLASDGYGVLAAVVAAALLVPVVLLFWASRNGWTTAVTSDAT